MGKHQTISLIEASTYAIFAFIISHFAINIDFYRGYHTHFEQSNPLVSSVVLMVSAVVAWFVIERIFRVYIFILTKITKRRIKTKDVIYPFLACGAVLFLMTIIFSISLHVYSVKYNTLSAKEMQLGPEDDYEQIATEIINLKTFFTHLFTSLMKGIKISGIALIIILLITEVYILKNVGIPIIFAIFASVAGVGAVVFLMDWTIYFTYLLLHLV